MKKILSLIFAFLLIFSCFAVTAFAEDVAIGGSDTDGWFTVVEDEDLFGPDGELVNTDTKSKITFSEDFKKMYVDGEPFSRIDASMLNTEFLESDYYTEYYYVSVELTDAQQENVKKIFVEPNDAKNMFYFSATYNDGSSLTATYLKDACLDEYNQLINGNAEEYFIDFSYPTGNIVIAQREALFGETVELSQLDFMDLYDYFYVTATNKDGTIAMDVGQLFVLDGNFYYVDFIESGLDMNERYLSSELDRCIIHKITDENLLAELTSAEQRYYEDDYGILYDDNATDTISAVFLIFVFAVVPFIILVIFLIKAIRGKGIYQKIYGAVAALCVAELAVFTIIAVIISNLN